MILIGEKYQTLEARAERLIRLIKYYKEQEYPEMAENCRQQIRDLDVSLIEDASGVRWSYKIQ